jgi:hypothetical protein
MLKELSCLDEVFRANSNSYLWLFKSSLAAISRLSAFFSRSTTSSARITWKSRAFDLLSNLSCVAAREVCAVSSSSANVALASLAYGRDCAVACLAAFSSTREFSALNRADFSSDNAFCAVFKLLANTVNKKVVNQPKRLKERNSEGVKGLPS